LIINLISIKNTCCCRIHHGPRMPVGIGTGWDTSCCDLRWCYLSDENIHGRWGLVSTPSSFKFFYDLYSTVTRKRMN
jgi:hypothetical protein